MRFTLTAVGLMLLSGLGVCPHARAGVIVFDTESTADQMISSPLLGTFVARCERSANVYHRHDQWDGQRDLGFSGRRLAGPIRPWPV